MNAADIYRPFGAMLALTAAFALFWTLVVQRVHPFRPVPVEEALEKEFNREVALQLPTIEPVLRGAV